MIRAITALAHEPFEPHQARGAKEIRPDLAALERIDEDALDAGTGGPVKGDCRGNFFMLGDDFFQRREAQGFAAALVSVDLNSFLHHR